MQKKVEISQLENFQQSPPVMWKGGQLLLRLLLTSNLLQMIIVVYDYKKLQKEAETNLKIVFFM